MKLMCAVWGDHLGDALRAPALHDRLAGRGVCRLQLNIDDADVAPALRISTSERPVGAVVSIWADDDADPEALTDALDDERRLFGGWEVEERRSMDPPSSPSGTRMDALANVALLKRPDDLDREEWLHRWLVEHDAIAKGTQATFGYAQNIVLRELRECPVALHRVDGLAEELYPMAAVYDIHAFYGSGGDDAELDDRITRLLNSSARFGADRDLDLVPSSRYVYELV